jgi:ferredoxin
MARKNVHRLCRNKITRIFAPSLPTSREADTETDNSHTNNNFKFTTMAYVISDDCIACGTCIDECPAGAISEGAKYSINPDVCVDCGTCADVCPTGAIAPGE